VSAVTYAEAPGVTPEVGTRFRTRWSGTRTPTPFAIYCLLAGPVAVILVDR
jgi:hypothetical protein